MGLFDSFTKKSKENEAPKEAARVADDESSAGPGSENSNSSDALISAVREARKQALLKEHRYRAGVISFVSVVMDDLQSASEKNYPAVISMTVATLKNFIEAESGANADLLASLKDSE